MKNPTSNMIPAGLIAASIAVAGLMAPVAAAQDVVTFDVSYSDSELATKAGNQAVLERIEKKAKRACGSAHQRLTLQNQIAQNKCVSIAVENAVKSISAPELVAQYKQNAAG
ncbi:UrcA family protein [Hirschia maritima]|uniref:UrcA family protein n=1 Tax=Hirschia maritima TaxID=1121961 RepID=UPI000371DF82|nr:UrcA family protein [Hirschia maritima]